MTPRERVLTVLAREPPDRVPINYSANAAIDGRLKANFGLKPADAEGLRLALGVDFRGIPAHRPARRETTVLWAARCCAPCPATPT